MNAAALAPVGAGPSIAGARATHLHEPETVADCAVLLADCSRDKRTLAVVGGGTALELGNPPTSLDTIVFTRRLDRVLEYAPEDQVIVVEAGLTLARLQALIGQNRQWLGVDAPQAASATVGGLVAVSAFGPRRARYGGIRDLLLGITLVRADGGIAKSGGKVVKNVAGWDLPKLVCGSLGTLGLIAVVTLRLHPLPETSVTLRLEGIAPGDVLDMVRELRRAQLEPSSVVALRSGAGRFELGVRFEGFERGVARDTARALELGPCLRARAGRLDPREAESFWQRQGMAREPAPLRVRVSALPSHAVEVDHLLAPLLATLEGSTFSWYATLGIGFASGKPVQAANVPEALVRARAGLVKLGGSLVVEAAPPELRSSVDAWGPAPSGLAIMQGLKQRFDPEHVLNPGRFIAGI